MRQLTIDLRCLQLCERMATRLRFDFSKGRASPSLAPAASNRLWEQKKAEGALEETP